MRPGGLSVIGPPIPRWPPSAPCLAFRSPTHPFTRADVWKSLRDARSRVATQAGRQRSCSLNQAGGPLFLPRAFTPHRVPGFPRGFVIDPPQSSYRLTVTVSPRQDLDRIDAKEIGPHRFARL